MCKLENEIHEEKPTWQIRSSYIAQFLDHYTMTQRGRQNFTSTHLPQQPPPKLFALWSHTKMKAKTQMTLMSQSSKWTASPVRLTH